VLFVREETELRHESHGIATIEAFQRLAGQEVEFGRQHRLQVVAIEERERKIVGRKDAKQRKSQAGHKPAPSADPIVSRVMRHQ